MNFGGTTTKSYRLVYLCWEMSTFKRTVRATRATTQTRRVELIWISKTWNVKKKAEEEEECGDAFGSFACLIYSEPVKLIDKTWIAYLSTTTNLTEISSFYYISKKWLSNSDVQGVPEHWGEKEQKTTKKERGEIKHYTNLINTLSLSHYIFSKSNEVFRLRSAAKRINGFMLLVLFVFFSHRDRFQSEYHWPKLLRINWRSILPSQLTSSPTRMPSLNTRNVGTMHTSPSAPGKSSMSTLAKASCG